MDRFLAKKKESVAPKRSASPRSPKSPKRENGGQKSKEQRTVEEIYQKKSQVEHILLRPDSYVGSTERQQYDHWTYNAKGGQMTQRKLDYIPALYKIFDEILVNAADNLVRSPLQDTIKVEVDAQRGCISVWNNGAGLPVEIHKEHRCYVPELVFGQLLTSDNYDDSERKVVGGRNGYGAKLTNIFSSKFIVETADSARGKWYKQVWEKNMGTRREPQLKSVQGQDFTKVTFFPDLARLGMSGLEDDIVALMRRRAYDIAACTHGRCQVYLDGQLLEVKSFSDYVDLHLPSDSFRICQVVNDRWEVALGLTDGSGFRQVSFVNSIATSRGGTHVDYIVNQVVNAVLEKFTKVQRSGLAVKAQHVKSYLWVFVNCLVENPAFDSQTKETLTSKRERFGSTCVLPESFLTEVLESGIVDALQEWSKAFAKSELAQHLNRSDHGSQKRLFGVPKLEDANKAGTKESQECTLILTEGDSAKALAVAGLGVIGRDHFGVFPLRGKLRNVRDLSIKQMLDNKEIDQVAKIMALDASKEYRDTKGLRYGAIMIMTDQDHDGSHIKGLILNFVQHCFPSLFRVPGFLKEFVTPIVKVTRGAEVQSFFTLPEYMVWKEENNGGQGWTCKYYKGLGTSTSAEAREYFSDIENHEIEFTYGGDEDDDLIDMAFNVKRADHRKQWIGACEEGTCVDHSQPTLGYNDFINKELVLFAKYDVERAIPSVVDGLKPGQRKVLFGVFKKKVTSDMKVAQLAGYVGENSAYHHGEASLQGTIVGMAQTFVGSNNINLLFPSGQFGTRLQGGKDHAAARYIFTRMSKTTRCIFSEEDDAVLDYLNDEGLSIEPRWYCPVIPLVLANGADGIGTGWSTTVPNYNPRDIIANIRRQLRGEALVPMTPWFRGFKGSIREVAGNPGKFDVTGLAQRRGRVRLEIVELPVRRWTQDYKEWLLEQLPQPGSERRPLVTELREYHTENSVHFVLSMTPDKLAEAEHRGFERTFHLRGSLATTNMWLFDKDGKIKKYETPEEVMEDFKVVRLEIYGKRKEHQLAKLARELAIISNKVRFIELVVTEQLEVERRKSSELCADMRKHGLQTMREINGERPLPSKSAAVDDSGPDGYKYLLSMKLWSLTEEKLKSLNEQRRQKEAALEELRNTTLEMIWERDLQKLEAALDAEDAREAKDAAEAEKMARKAQDGENLLVNKQCLLVLSRQGCVKRVSAHLWKAKTRGKGLGTGVVGSKKTSKPAVDGEAADVEKEEEEKEEIADVFCCHDFDALLVFANDGTAFMMQALDVPQVKNKSQGGSMFKELLPELKEKARVVACVSIPQGQLKHQSDEFIVMVSAEGFAKKVGLDKFKALRPGKGVACMKLEAGDELRWAHRASRNCALVTATTNGFLLRCSLGADWSMGSLKGPGRFAMKRNPGDTIAACSVSPLTQQEISGISSKMILKEQKRKDNGGEADNNATQAKRPKLQDGRCDDDDSDNGADGAAAAAGIAGGAAEEESDGAMSEDGDGEEGEAESDGEKKSASPARKTSASPRRKSASPARKKTAVAIAPDAMQLDTMPITADPSDTMQLDSMPTTADPTDAAGASASQPAPTPDGDGSAAAAAAPPATEVSAAGAGTEAAAGAAEGAVAEASPNAAADSQAKVPDLCALVVTRRGMAMRAPLASKHIGLIRKGGKGKKVLKLQGNDEVVAAVTVSGQAAVAAPEKAKEAWKIWMEEKLGKPEKEAVTAEPSLSQPQLSQPMLSQGCNDDTMAGGEGLSQPDAVKREPGIEFLALPQEEQDFYAAKAEEDKRRYERDLEEYERKLEESEEVFIGSTAGLMSRVRVVTVPIFHKARVPQLFIRLNRGNHVCVVSVVPSTAQQDSDVAGAPKTGAQASQQPAATSSSARPRPAPPRRRNQAVAGRGGAGDAAALPAATAKDGAVPVVPLGGLAPRPRRLRGKTAAAFLGPRARLSHLVTSSPFSTRPAARLMQKTPRHSVVLSPCVEGRRSVQPVRPSIFKIMRPLGSLSRSDWGQRFVIKVRTNTGKLAVESSITEPSLTTAARAMG